MRRALRRWQFAGLVVMLISLFVAACDSTTNNPTPRPTMGQSTSSNPSPPTTNGGDNSASAITPSRSEKIAAAEAAGKIDHDTALLYQLYAKYAPASLPAEYQSDNSAPTSEVGGYLDQASIRLDAMPADLRTKVAPFLMRPTNPASFWYSQLHFAASGRLPGLASPTDHFRYKDSQHIRVWYVDEPSEEPIATQLTQEIDRSGMWDKEKAIMQEATIGNHEPCSDLGYQRGTLVEDGGDARLDVYLDVYTRGNTAGEPKILPLGVDGDTISQTFIDDRACKTAQFIALADSGSFDQLRVTLAHELLHAFQNAVPYPHQNSERDYRWWCEASATWVERIIYPNLDGRQAYITSGGWANFGSAPTALDSTTNLDHAYGAYIWPLYLANQTDNSIVGHLWQMSISQPPIKAMYGLANWDDKWKDFAYSAWNREPFVRLLDHGGKLNALQQTTIKLANNGSIDLKQPYLTDVSLPHASFAYYELASIDDQVRAVTFDLKDISGKPGASVQALVTIHDQPPAYRDWSKEGKVKFCLNRKDERLDNVVLIVANSDPQSDPSKWKISVEGDPTPCDVAPASFTYDQDFSYASSEQVSTSGAGMKVKATGSVNGHESISSRWDVAFDRRDGDDLYYTFTATNNINYGVNGTLNSTATFPDGMGGTSTISRQIDEQGSGSGTTHNPPLPGEPLYQRDLRDATQNNGGGDDSGQSSADPSAINQDLQDTLDVQHGTIQLSANGKFHIEFAPAGIAGNYTYRYHSNANCSDDYRYDNLGQTIQEGCDPPRATDGPALFGDWRIYNRTAKSFGPSIDGSYDPQSGVLQFDDSYTATDCLEAEHLSFLSNAGVTHTDFNAIQAPLTCNAHYTVHLSLKLPPVE